MFRKSKEPLEPVMRDERRLARMMSLQVWQDPWWPTGRGCYCSFLWPQTANACSEWPWLGQKITRKIIFPCGFL